MSLLIVVIVGAGLGILINFLADFCLVYVNRFPLARTAVSLKISGNIFLARLVQSASKSSHGRL